MTIITVKTGGIAADAVTDAKIADDVVGTEHLTANEVDTTALKADAVTGAELADNAVNSEHYTDGSIDTAHIADNQVTLAKMAGGTDGNIISFDASGDPVAIATGSDGQVLTSTGAGSPPAFEAIPAGGITMVDQYRLTGDANYAAGTNTITGTYERNDTAGAGLLGTGVSESSGVFTFPATGIYLIDAGLYLVRHNTTSRYNLLGIRTCQDGSSFADRVQIPTHVEDVSGQHANANGSYIFDVTNTSTHKVLLVLENQGSITLAGDTSKDRSWIRFIRLGDT